MVTLVVDTNILVRAFPTRKGVPIDSKASEMIWRIFNDQYCIAVDDENRIMDNEYKKYMMNNQHLTSWMTSMRLSNKITHRCGTGEQIGDLKEMDNCFACVALRTPDRILITENWKHFNEDIKRRLARRNVRVLYLDEAYEMVCNARRQSRIRKIRMWMPGQEIRGSRKPQ